MPEFAQYMTESRDVTVAELMEQASFEIIDPVVDVLSAFAQFQSPAEGFVLRDLALLGSETVGDFACDHIQFSLGGRIYDLWIEQGPARLVRRIQPDMTDLEQKYKSEYQMDFDIAVTADLPVWEIDTDVSDAVRFSPPAGAEQVDKFGPKPPAVEMEGEPAPDFTLPLLDGGEFTLSKARGSIVILDFWATWCGPCRIAMPVLSEVSREFADKGVKLISIDLEEDPADVKAFLSQMGLDVTVALDRDSSVAQAYQVSGIPQTVIVGRDGVIQKVHVGLWAMPEFSTDDSQEQQMTKANAVLAEALRAELNEILEAAPAQ
jgi:thiol-disulfide isomerase/thioredoxin